MNKSTIETINAIRVLSAEAIEKAKSGHPGLPLGAAPIGYALFANNLKYNPKNPAFFDRDRFVLSAGHGSMLYYSLLYLFGYDLKEKDLSDFRQLSSKTPGHPEYGVTPGVETSTGPLGQGIANAVGMAMAEAHLAAIFNKDGFNIVDHYTYALCGDGCLQEGISYEAATFAGTHKLGKLILLYDCNKITIEGSIDTAFTADVKKSYEAFGWQVLSVKDANDVTSINRAIKKAKAEKNKPSMIIINSVIGYGSPLAGKADCHGAPLGQENLQKLKENLGWNYPPFKVPVGVKRHCKRLALKSARAEEEWNKLFEAYKAAYPELAEKFLSWQKGELPDLSVLDEIKFEKADATRGTSSVVLNKLSEIMPNLMGGSADLGPSNKSIMKGKGYFSADNYAGSNLQFGIREHAMAAICNGLYLHGGIIPYSATFFVFSDYMKNAMRLAALMKLPVIYILTHDSIGVGEDGPTHQPVEQLIGLRSIPGMKVFRPADGKETVAAWKSALTGNAPTALILSRQTLPLSDKTGAQAIKGGYILSDSKKQVPDAILMASGSEVELAVKAQEALLEKGVDARVVSMPCMEEFDKQSEEYKESVLPDAVRARVAVEAGSTYSWYKYVGLDGEVIGIDSFGVSAPAKVLFEKYGFTVDNVVNKALKAVKKNK